MNERTGHTVFDYQILPREPKPTKRRKAEKFCRSCGHPLPKRAVPPIGIQLFYCQPDCAFDASIHAAMKGYASPQYIDARRAHDGKSKRNHQCGLSSQNV